MVKSVLPRDRRIALFSGVLIATLCPCPLAAQESPSTALRSRLPDRPPIELRSLIPIVPPELAGSQRKFEIAVRLLVDAHGRVSEVEVEKITPSTEFDPLLAAAAEEALSRNVYAPRIRNGEAVKSTLRWTIQLDAVDGTGGGRSARSLSRPSMALQEDFADAEQRRSRILALPTEERVRRLEEITGRAKSLLNAERIQRFSSSRFLVLTDAPDPKTAEIVANNLEAVYGTLYRLLQPPIKPLPEPYKMVVVVYATEAQYKELVESEERMEWSAGFYYAAGFLALHLQHQVSDAILSTLLHEATHAYLDRHVVRRGRWLPRWLGEGFAEYVGNSKIKAGKLIPGKRWNRKAYMTQWGPVFAKTDPQRELESVKRAIHRGEALSLSELVSAGPEIFYGDQRWLYYPMSWLLTHFLCHGNPTWAEDKFPTFLLYVAEGYAAADALATVYGASPAEFEPQFRRYVLKF